MSNKKTKKLLLNRETLRKLDPSELERAGGGVSAVCGATVWWEECKKILFPPTGIVRCGSVQ